MEQKTKRFKKRDAILDCVRQTKVHPSADWVYARLKPDISDLSLGTVKGVERFDGNNDPHVHFVCEGCGEVTDLMEIQLPPELTTAATQMCGGTIQSSQLIFSGKCRNCQE